jgi:hypothetical protein
MHPKDRRATKRPGQMAHVSGQWPGRTVCVCVTWKLPRRHVKGTTANICAYGMLHGACSGCGAPRWRGANVGCHATAGPSCPRLREPCRQLFHGGIDNTGIDTSTGFSLTAGRARGREAPPRHRLRAFLLAQAELQAGPCSCAPHNTGTPHTHTKASKQALV